MRFHGKPAGTYRAQAIVALGGAGANLLAAALLGLLSPLGDYPVRALFFQLLTAEQIRMTMRTAVTEINRLHREESRHQPELLARRLRRWARRLPDCGYAARQELRRNAHRYLIPV